MSPLPMSVPPRVCDVDSSSMTIEIPESTTVARKFVLVSAPHPAPLVSDLVSGLSAGVPLDRPEELLRLAEEVLGRPAGIPDTWAADLAADFAQFDD